MSVTSTRANGAASTGRAILMICAGVFFLGTNDAIAKWLMDVYTPLQIIFIRSLMAMPIVALIVLMIGGRDALRSRSVRVHAFRGVFLVAAAYTFFLGISILPLAEATSLVFAAPIFITALSVPLLGEHVGWRRWSAVIIGFIGVLIIVRPGASTFQPASLIVVGTAATHAVIMISARWIDPRESLWTMMFYVALFPLLFSGLVVFFEWRPVALADLPLFLGNAVFGTLGMTLISQAFRMAPAAIVAPFDYTLLLWASLFGWLIWGEIPSVWTYVGAAVIIASGIYIVIRETRLAQRGAGAPGSGKESRPSS